MGVSWSERQPQAYAAIRPSPTRKVYRSLPQNVTHNRETTPEHLLEASCLLRCDASMEQPLSSVPKSCCSVHCIIHTLIGVVAREISSPPRHTADANGCKDTAGTPALSSAAVTSLCLQRARVNHALVYPGVYPSLYPRRR